MKMKAPDGCGGLSINGEQIKINKKGFCDVPAEFAGEAIAHGFGPVAGDPDGSSADDADQKKTDDAA